MQPNGCVSLYAIRKAARGRLLPLEEADDYRVLVVLVTCSAA
jgi:hypothetical protein